MLAEVGPMFFGHWFGAALATLVGDAGVVKDAVEAYAKGINMVTPEIPMTSNVSGSWLSDDDVTASRWAEHVVGTVKFGGVSLRPERKGDVNAASESVCARSDDSVSLSGKKIHHPQGNEGSSPV